MVKELSVEERFELIKRGTEEIIGEEELLEYLKNDEKLKHYIGFEISNKISTSLPKGIKGFIKK